MKRRGRSKSDQLAGTEAILEEPTSEERGTGSRAPMYDPSMLERGIGRQYPLPLESVHGARRLLEAALASAQRARTDEQQSRRKYLDEEDHEEGPSRLARAFDRLRLYAHPDDRADWDALDRARAHRQWMRSGRDPRFRASILGTLGEWEFIGPRRFDVGGGTWVSGRVNAIAIDPKRTRQLST
jgi:hypothetical protein